MFFGKKSGKIKCARCEGILKNEFSFCPYCGCSLISKEEMERNYGLLGKNDSIDSQPNNIMGSNLGITDKIINNMFNMVMKNLSQQIGSDMENAEISQLPNGIKISIGGQPVRKKQAPKFVKKTLTEDQLQRISSLPRKEAKSTIRRLPDKVVYELNTPGVLSTEDIFISKLESGYEVKALGNKNMYVNSLQVSLPLKGISVDKNKVFIEFNTREN